MAYDTIWARVEDERERGARWALWTIRGLGYRRFKALLSRCGGETKTLWAMSAEELGDALKKAGVPQGVAEQVLRRTEAPPSEGLEDALQRLPQPARIIHIGDDLYPKRLLDLDDPPVFITAWGRVEALVEERAVAIVGSRKATVVDVTLTEAIAAALGRAGIMVVSGGALGIDAGAHRGALAGAGVTTAVLPGGLDALTPRTHRRLFEDIAAAAGVLVSEYPPGVQAQRFHFRRRNRLIAALGDITLIVRAELRSGTMLTAEAAAELGRDLLVVPGAPDDPLAAGCLDLLVGGAAAVRDAPDVLRALDGETGRSTGPRRIVPRGTEESDPIALQPGFTGRAGKGGAKRRSPAAPPGLSPGGLRIFDELVRLASGGKEVVHVDELARALETSVAELGHGLLELELGGAIARVGGSHAYRLCH